MARGEQRSNREKKKPKKEKNKTIAVAPSQKGAPAGWQPNLASGKKRVVCSGALLDESLCGRGRHLPVVQSILWFVKRGNADANAY
jgi:hypothetical protein